VTLGDISLAILHTPGHTPGSISILFEKSVFTGDLLFPNGELTMEMEEADEDARLNSINRILAPRAQGVDITAHPGHGPSFPLSEVLKTGEVLS
jgi:glyoxylase-like metal-dependent hydrolase (beta-lactamase superfamily II)